MNEQGAIPPPERRGTLGWKTLAMLGIAFAAGGCFSPWSYGIDAAGWGGMLVAFAVVAAFYLCLLLCLAELSSAIPSAGAGQAFASRAFGAAAGFFAGAASLIQYVFGTSALGYLLASYLVALTGIDLHVAIVALYLAVVAIHARGVAESANLTIVLSLLAIAGVLLFLVVTGAAIQGHARTAEVAATPVTLAATWAALPFAVGLLLGLEGVPFAAEEASDPARDVPRALFAALGVTVLLAALVLALAPLGAGTAALHGADAPLLAALAPAGMHAAPWLVVAVNAAGLCGIGVAFFSSVFGYSRQVAAMAGDGELPAFLGRVSRRHVPLAALMVPSALGMLVALSGRLDQLIVLMVFAGAISYLMIFASFLALRARQPRLHRPYRLAGGPAVAALGILLGAVIFSACIASDPRWSLYGAAMLGALLLYRVATAGKRAPAVPARE